jgi:predicted transcriptional regulator
MTTISIRIEEDEKEKLQEYAKEQDLTLSQVIRRAIRDFIASTSK